MPPRRALLDAAGRTGRTGLRLRDVLPRHDVPLRTGVSERLTAGSLHRDAAWAERSTTPRIASLAEHGLEVRRLETARKDLGSLSRKVADLAAPADRRGTPARPRPPAESLATVNDTVRYTVVADEAAYAADVRRVVELLRERDLELAGEHTAWSRRDRGAYKGLNLALLDRQTGRLVEVQVHTPASLEASELTHGLYEVARDVRQPDRVRADARELTDAVYRDVPLPPQVSTLGRQLAALPHVPARAFRVDGGAGGPRVLGHAAVGAAVGAAAGPLLRADPDGDPDAGRGGPVGGSIRGGP
ncbi:hypothetical protein [Angustibacter aerolatus]